MPELPEVETIVRQLAPLVEGRRISRVEIFDPKLCEPIPSAQLEHKLNGLHILKLGRRGKYFVFELGAIGDERPSSYLVLHLRMTGNLLYTRKASADEQPHLRAFLQLDDQAHLQFIDSRRFGRATLFISEHDLSEYFEGRLGVEPLSNKFTPELLANLIEKSTRPIKSFLLDQSRIAGIGNIYANEALYRAKIHPAQPAGTVNTNEIQHLHTSIVESLRAGISAGGASIDSFRHYDGGSGSMQNEFLVHNREGQACPRCRTEIVKIRLSGRGTYICNSCQPLRRRKLAH